MSGTSIIAQIFVPLSLIRAKIVEESDSQVNNSIDWIGPSNMFRCVRVCAMVGGRMLALTFGFLLVTYTVLKKVAK